MKAKKIKEKAKKYKRHIYVLIEATRLEKHNKSQIKNHPPMKNGKAIKKNWKDEKIIMQEIKTISMLVVTKKMKI